MTVAVYDDGVEYTHPDLAGNYDPTMHFVHNGLTYDPMPLTSGDAHGTAVAGIIGGVEGNGLGGVGVAWDVTLTGFNFLEELQYLHSSIMFAALEYAENFDIMSNSWGSTPFFDSWQDLGDAGSWRSRFHDSYESVIENGRGGLGTIIAQAAGNDTLDANGDGLNASRFTVTVAATGYNSDYIASYSNYGPSILIAAPASSHTTDLQGTGGYNTNGGPAGDYTTTFGGTSAATPTTSGVIALMLEANPDLGWRDIQNILAYSAAQTGSAYGSSSGGSEVGEWFDTGNGGFNGGDLTFHMSYGFGMIDAFGAVRMAEIWLDLHGDAQTSGNEITHTQTNTFGAQIPDGATAELAINVSQNLQVEHIYVTVDLTHAAIEDLDIYLVDPDGNRIQIMFEDNFFGAWGATALEYTFGVTAFLGAYSVGEWTLEVEDTELDTDTGVLNSFKIEFFGRAVTTDDVYHFTNDFLTLKAQDADRGTITDTNGGNDWLNFAAVTAALDIDLHFGSVKMDGVTQAGFAPSTVIENTAGGDGNDRILGDHGDNILLGMRGDDSLFGRDGDDILKSGVGNDVLKGQGGNDTLHGEDGRDRLVGDAGNDTLLGGAGNDKLLGGVGADLYDGGVGFDVAVFNTGAFTLDLTDSTQNVGETVGDTFIGIERYVGSNSDDILRGTNARDRFNGGGGNDTIEGRGGNDILVGGLGADVILGGAGIDIALFNNGVFTLDLTDPTQNIGETIGDIFTDIEKFLGGKFNDTMFGAALRDNFNGGAGNDTLDGRGGSDILNGGFGDDQLTGGSGADFFVFNDGADAITDFESGVDTIRISDRDFAIGFIDAAHVMTFASVIGDDAVFDFGNGDTLTLSGISSLVGLESQIQII